MRLILNSWYGQGRLHILVLFLCRCSSSDKAASVTPGVERLRTGACGVVVVVVSGGVTGSEMGRGIC
jgi:hypothetical protein